MTAKEKAKQLTDRFYFSLPNNGSFTGINNVNSRWEEGKKCALIAVDEVSKLQLNIGQHLKEDEDKMNYYSYWEEVKEEIEKL